MPKIIVSNLPINLSLDVIRTMFSKYGTVLEITKSSNTNNVFIKYKTSEACKQAISQMNGIEYEKSILIVDRAFERNNKCFVYNISIDTSLEEIKDFFNYYGNIEYCKFIKNVLLLVFEDRKDVEKLQELDNKIYFKNKLLSIKNTMSKEVKGSDNKSVFIYNICDTMTEMDLLEIFNKYGNVLSSGIIGNGKGYVNYEEELSALKAVKYLDSKKVKGKKIRVVLKSEKYRSQ